jgi:L,D-transpeptidase ErfK/SrfK
MPVKIKEELQERTYLSVMRSFFLLVLLFVFTISMSGLHAQDDLTTRLRQLPASIGENKTIAVKPGESWVDIGIRERVGYEHLRRANPGGFSSGTILIPGRHQVPGLVADGMVVNLPELMDFRWQDGKPVAWYPVSIGRVTSRWHTPVGKLQVINRAKNPAWHRPSWAGGGVVPAGPKNPLGDRWVGLSAPGYGLHGTNDQTSIGRMVSHGCIRHFAAHIHQIFDSAYVGMPVIIEYNTVTIGQDDGIVYMAVFPDIYAHGTNAPSQVRAKLASLGLEQVFTQTMLEQRIRQADGVARSILGSDIPVTLNGQPLNSPIGPTIREGVSYLPLRAIADQLGAVVEWQNDTATVTRGNQTVSFPLDGSFIALNTIFVPVRDLVEKLAGTAAFDPQQGIALTVPPAS